MFNIKVVAVKCAVIVVSVFAIANAAASCGRRVHGQESAETVLLFLDSHHLRDMPDGVDFITKRPERYRDTPVLASALLGGDNYQHNVRVLDGSPHEMWYTQLVGTEPGQDPDAPAYAWSDDGETWIPQEQVFTITNTVRYRPSFVDRDVLFSGVWPSSEQPPGDKGFPPRVVDSVDGFFWASSEPLLPTGYGELYELYQDGDQWGLLHRWNRWHVWYDANGDKHNFIRCYAHTRSADLYSGWPEPHTVFCDEGEPIPVEYYVSSNVIRRGDYLVATLGILRDDTKASGTPDTVECPDGAIRNVFGTGWTDLIWSVDNGQMWSSALYFEPDTDTVAFDHAHAWGTYLTDDAMYYGAYQYGHKVYCDRSIGKARIHPDRYRGLAFGPVNVRVHSTPFVLSSPLIEVNMVAEHDGRGVFAIHDGDTTLPIDGYRIGQCGTLYGDNDRWRIVCEEPLEALVGRNIHVSVKGKNAVLYAVYAGGTPPVSTSTPTPTITATSTPTATPTATGATHTPTATPTLGTPTATPTATPIQVQIIREDEVLDCRCWKVEDANAFSRMWSTVSDWVKQFVEQYVEKEG